MNTTLLQSFEDKARQTQLAVNNYRKIPVRLSDIRKSGNTFLTGDQSSIRNNALKDLLNIFSIKNDLVGEIKDDSKQWEPLQKTLANIKNDRTITAIVNTASQEKEVVRFLKNEIEEESPLNLNQGLDLLKTYLEKNGEGITLHNMSFNSETLQIETQIRNVNKKIDVFNNEQDIWDTGFNLFLGENRTLTAPFLLRLICTNGMVSTEMISQRYIDNSRLKEHNFTKIINKTVDSDISEVVKLNCDRLRQTNASLRELFKAKDALLGYSKDLASEYFDDSAIQEAYRPYKIKYKNSRWLSTANTNINSYEFFNRLTHCISHQDLSPGVRMELNNMASSMFFKGPDLNFQAPNPFAVINN